MGSECHDMASGCISRKFLSTQGTSPGASASKVVGSLEVMVQGL